eukprot:2418353-Rhodomonas_salina.1
MRALARALAASFWACANLFASTSCRLRSCIFTAADITACHTSPAAASAHVRQRQTRDQTDRQTDTRRETETDREDGQRDKRERERERGRVGVGGGGAPDRAPGGGR